MMRRFLTAVLLFLFATSAIAVTTERVKLGTLAPKDSSFHKILIAMGTRWGTQNVELKIYPGAVRGGEADMVREMRNGALDCALLTVNGLMTIDKSVEALQDMPMMFRSLDEAGYVWQRLRPTMEKTLRQKGFVVLFWTDAGWVRFFSTKPITRPDDLRRLKIFSWAGDNAAVDIYKAGGFDPVPLETTDILPSLQTGMISAVAMPPYIALTTQTFVHAKNMLLLDWAPLVGALVITEKSWNRFPPEAQRELARAAAEAGAQMQARNRIESDQAVEAMRRRGLSVTPLTPAQVAEWRGAVEASYPALRARKIGPELFDEVLRLTAEYRARAQGGGQ